LPFPSIPAIPLPAAALSDNPDIHFSLTDKIIDNRFQVQQGIIAGCAGGNYSNVMAAAHILENAACGCDEVTTTDELIPSGETSSYRSNPLGLAEFTLSRRDPEYVGRSKKVRELEEIRIKGGDPARDDGRLKAAYEAARAIDAGVASEMIEIGSMIYCVKPGDGSAREQAANCQRVLGGLANICKEYATKRYRSNVMNWGMIPFQMKAEPVFEVGDYLYIPHIRQAMDDDMKDIKAYVLGAEIKEISLYIADMTSDEKKIVKAGCLINYNRNRQ